MVYNLYTDEIEIETVKRKKNRRHKKSSSSSSKSLFYSLSAKLLLSFIKLILIIYDLITLPIYFVLQRPDLRAHEALRTRSERVDINTWIKTDQNHNEFSYLSNENGSVESESFKIRKYKFMGSTLNDIFANSIREYKTRPCLGYRAVVTCPVLTLNEEGKHVLQDKSFRSDFTWYTYEQVGRRVQDLASGLNMKSSIYPNTRALFFASTSLEWFLTAQACYQLGAQLVVAPEINDISSLILILKRSKINVIFTSCDKLLHLAQLYERLESHTLPGDEDFKVLFQVKRIVLIDWLFSIDLTEPAFATLREISELMMNKMISLGQIEEAGVENPINLSCTKYLQEIEIEDFCEHNIDSLSPTSFGRRGTKAQKNSVSSMNSNNRSKLISNYNRSSTKPSDLAMIVYYHGKLGQLKAVMLTHAHLARSNHYLFLDGIISGQDVHCTTLALDNVIEFMTESCIFSHGGSIGYSSNSNTLFYDGKELFKRDLSDLETLNPTILLVRPYILEQLRSSIQNYLNLNYNPLKYFLLNNLICSYKKYWTKKHFRTPIVDKIFNRELRKLFGNKLKFILCNGATDCSETKDFFAFIVNVPVIELYGPDEAMASLISINDIRDFKRRIQGNSWFDDELRAIHRVNTSNQGEDVMEEDFPDMQLMPPKIDKNIFRVDSSKNLLITSSILSPTLGTRIRLEDWEDFKTSDLPYPRGRMIIGGDVVCKGYYLTNDEVDSSGSFYQDSNYINWFRTDDIARVFPNGSFEIISGLSDIIKMSNGQFISLSQIEHILKNSQFVDNVCAICGDDRKFIIALVVPNLRRLALKSPDQANLKSAIGMDPEPDELVDIEFRREVCNDRLLCEFVTKHLSELMVKANFNSEQAIPSHFHLVPEIWTPETELVTPSFEPKRSAVQNFYATDIQSIIKMKFRRSSARLSSKLTRKGSPNFNGSFRLRSSDGRLSC